MVKKKKNSVAVLIKGGCQKEEQGIQDKEKSTIKRESEKRNKKNNNNTKNKNTHPELLRT